MSDDPIIRITAPRNDAPAKRPALGRGLGALLGDTRREEPLVTSTPRGESAVSLPAGQGLAMLAVAAIAPHPEQPRRHFDDAALDELAASIAARGVIQPVIVRPLGPGRWQLVAGERRWRAAQRAQLHEIPAIIRDLSEREVMALALIENLQREDLNPMEEAKGYVRLAKEFSMKQDEIASRVGKSRASVANAMRLLDLHSDVQLLVAQGRLTVGHAKAILAIKDQDSQLLASDQVIKRQLTVRAAEKLTQALLNGSLEKPGDSSDSKKPGAREVDIHIRAIANRLREHLATHVAIQHSAKKGRIEIEYYGDDDLQRLIELIGLGASE